MDFFKKAKNNSFAYKIYEKRNKLSTCYLFDDSNFVTSFSEKDFRFVN